MTHPTIPAAAAGIVASSLSIPRHVVWNPPLYAFCFREAVVSQDGDTAAAQGGPGTCARLVARLLSNPTYGIYEFVPLGAPADLHILAGLDTLVVKKKIEMMEVILQSIRLANPIIPYIKQMESHKLIFKVVLGCETKNRYHIFDAQVYSRPLVSSCPVSPPHLCHPEHRSRSCSEPRKTPTGAPG